MGAPVSPTEEAATAVGSNRTRRVHRHERPRAQSDKRILHGGLLIEVVLFQEGSGRTLANRTAYSMAFTMLSSFAVPCPAWSNAVP